eukprot:scaffold32427_cov112-Isochrysis_galbana.AAC.2
MNCLTGDRPTLSRQHHCHRRRLTPDAVPGLRTDLRRVATPLGPPLGRSRKLKPRRHPQE